MQHESAWLSDQIEELPLVLMSDMARSPAARAMNFLSRCLLGPSEMVAVDPIVEAFLYRYANLDQGRITLWYRVTQFVEPIKQYSGVHISPNVFQIQIICFIDLL